MTTQKLVNTPVKLTATDTQLTNHVWKVNGVQESTNAAFTKTFTTKGLYTIRHEGGNNCGNCSPVDQTIEIIEPTPVQMGGSVMIIAGLGLLVGTIYLLIKKKV